MYIAPSSPAQSVFIDRFNRTDRSEVLDVNLFESIEHVQFLTDDWFTIYKHEVST